MATEDQTSVPASDVTPSMSRSGIASAKLNPERVESPAQHQSELELKFSKTLNGSLRVLRNNILQAAGEDVKPKDIFSNNTLNRIAIIVPRTTEELLEVQGIDKARVTKYGDQVLETIESTIKDFYHTKKTSSGSDGNNSAKRRKCSIAPAKGSLASGKFNSQQVESPVQPQSELELKLFKALKTLRTSIFKAAGEGVRAFYIFTDATLTNISRRIPRTKEELLEVRGIGGNKAAKYGDQVLETIESAIKEFYNTEKTSSGSNSHTDSAKRRRDSIAPAKGSLALGTLNPQQVESPAQPLSELELKLSENLRTLRRNIFEAAGKGVRAYHIFSNATLKDISKRKPRTKEELLEVHEIAKKRVEKYGDQILQTVESTIKEFNNTEKTSSASNNSADSAKRRRCVSTPSNKISEMDQ